MRRSVLFIGLGIVALLAGPAAWAQYPSELVGFNGPPIDDEATCQEMFRQPGFSGTTSGYIVPNSSGAYDYNAAYRAAGLQTEGDAALRTFFNWVDPGDPDGWLRLTTFDGPERPNPALDTRGKVRFKLVNRSELFLGNIGVCIGVRETGGADVPQMGDGGTSGPIEWVGVDDTINAITAGADGIVDTTATGDDVQEYPVGYDVLGNGLPAGTAVISPGTNGTIETVAVPDDEYRYGYFINANGGRCPIPAIILPPRSTPAYELEWDLASGQVTVDGGTAVGTIAGFTGNGTLADAPDFRGTLEHIAITNVATDTATLIDFAIDEMQFEATVPDPTPPPSIIAPVVSSDTQVEVQCIADATEAELFIGTSSQGTAVPDETYHIATFNVSLSVGMVLTATQTANGETSNLSAPVVVYAPGTALAEDFNGYLSQEDMEEVWTQSEPDNDRRVRLTTGSACSCQNYVISDYAPGTTVSKISYSLGSVNGEVGNPLTVTYRFKHDINNSEARARFELSPSISKVYGAVGFAFTNGVGGDFGTQYTSMTNSPTPVIDGYASDYFGYDYALTGIDRVPGVWHEMKIVITDVVNFYIDGTLANPRDPRHR